MSANQLNPASIEKVTVFASSQTLASLGVNVNPQLQRLLLIPSGTVNWNRGAASAASAAIPTGGIEIPCDAANAAQLQFYAANVALQVIQFV